MASYMSTTLTIDSKGTQIFFTDTGAVPDSTDYTTVVCFHGTLFTGGIFERILPLAAPNNLRLIVLNRRGYPDSTPYTAEETDDLVSGGKIFLETVGLQVSQFLNAFLDRNDIPQASPDRKSGGLALLGWSQGACWALAPLGQSDIFHNFNNWVTQYFNHSDYKSIDGPVFGKGGMINPSYARMTPEEEERAMDVAAGVATDGAFPTDPIQIEVLKQTKLALFDEELAKTLFPELRISHIAGSKSFWPCLTSLMDTERLYKEYAAKGKKGRPIRFVVFDGANHVPHWDIPQTLIDVILKEIQS